MGRKSSIDYLPEDIREALDAALADGRLTQLQITDAINKLLEEAGAKKVSKSAVGRYAKNWAGMRDKMRQAREVSKVWIEELDAEPEGEVGRLIIELVRTMAFDLASSQLEGAGPASYEVIKAMAASVKDLELASKLSAERELAIRKEMAKAAADTAVKAARKGGLSKETADAIKRDILGLAQ